MILTLMKHNGTFIGTVHTCGKFRRQTFLSAVDSHALGECLNIIFLPRVTKSDEIGFRNMGLRGQHSVGEGSVISEKHKALSILIEPARREKSLPEHLRRY